MFDSIDVGATLFVPATHKNLLAILCKERYKGLKSVLVDMEDGIDLKEVEYATQRVAKILEVYQKKDLLVFFRPRDILHLQELLKMKDIEKIDGFILPKFSLKNAHSYLSLFSKTAFYMMPSIEDKELFHIEKLYQLQKILLQEKKRIPLVRFGLEDMLKHLGMERDCTHSVFDYSVTSTVVGNFLMVFKSVGFCVSGGVYRCYKDDKGFLQDIQRDLQEGLFGKTIIHPSQIALSNRAYMVTQTEYARAKAIINSDTNISAIDACMIEVSTMSPYALEILKRAKVYGIIKTKGYDNDK